MYFGCCCKWVRGSCHQILSYLIIMFHLTEVPVYFHHVQTGEEAREMWTEHSRSVNGMFYSYGIFTFGGMSKRLACNIFFNRLGSLLANKKDVLNLCLGSKFSLLCSAIDCLQGTWLSRGCPANLWVLDLALSGGQLSLHHHPMDRLIRYSCLAL